MATCRRREFPDNGFTFPLAEADEECSRLEFEFGSIVLDLPFGESIRNSPADRLFLNGKLLPHVFPCHTTRTGVTVSGISHAPSRASSVSIKDFSWMSSQSHSTNSRSSTCSGRTSSSDSSERSFPASLMCRREKSTAKMRIDGYIVREREKSRGSGCNAMEANYLYGSQRWQYITPGPSLSREASLRRRIPDQHVPQQEAKKTRGRKKGKGIFRRFVRSFLWSCMQCHAMEPSRKVDDVRQGN